MTQSFDYPAGTVTDDHLWLEANARDDGNEKVRLLHPWLACRSRILIETTWSVTGPGSAMIESAGRFESEQRILKALRDLPIGHPDRWPASVADPDRVVGPIGGTDIIVKGSYHMEQSDGWAHAVDIVPRGGGSYGAIHKGWRKLGGELGGSGLGLYVPREPWHWQALRKLGWLPGPVPALTSASGGSTSGRIPEMEFYYDEDSRRYKIHMRGVGTSDWLDDDPTHWRQVIEKGATTGVYKSKYMSDLVTKIEKAEALRRAA